MGTVQRKTPFGIPPAPQRISAQTTRLAPLTLGVQLNQPWSLLPPGSSISCSNFIAQDGKLRPRSRLSSLGTISFVAAGGLVGMTEMSPAGSGGQTLVMSGSTKHAILQPSNGGFSLASYTSAFGLGGNSPTAQQGYDYATIFLPALDANGVVICGKHSYDTLQILYDFSGAGQWRHSYLTGAPQAKAVGVYDSYIVALNEKYSSAGFANNRVRWCQRGSFSSWTGEGSGYEDLLAMRGRGTAVKSLDNRMILFSEQETWVAVTAAAPAQFDFLPLDPQMGCPFPLSIQESEFGLIFVGTDMALRVLPKGGGLSQPISGPVQEALRNLIPLSSGASTLGTFGIYDPTTQIYHLFPEQTGTVTRRPMSVHVVSGWWGFMDYADTIQTGVSATQWFQATRGEAMFYGSSAGSWFSANSKLASDSGATVTAAWRSAPLALDLPDTYKTVNKVVLNHRTTSRSTITVKVSGDGGNTYESTGRVMSLATAPIAGRAELDTYVGGPLPTIELTSNSTGFELHRLDVTFGLNGRP